MVGGALAIAAAATVGMRALRQRAPEVDRESLWIGTVARGPLALAVRGPGTLVPEEIRWASAPMAGRVEKVQVQPGAAVDADAILVELSNPDAELAALDAARAVAAAEAELARLTASLDGARLAQESAVVSMAADLAMASRRAQVDADMGRKGVLPELETAESRDRAQQLEGRLAFEKKRLGTMARGDRAQLAAQRAEVERLHQLAAFRQRQLDALTVRAGSAGVVQEVAVQVGQSLAVGAPLAKIVRPDRLKAELRIPEVQAQDVTVGLAAVIDTRSGTVTGTVARIDPAARNGSVTVDVALTGELPKAARPDLNVDGVIELEHTGDVLYVARPTVGEARAATTLFKITGDEAVRVPVRFGRAALQEIEVVSGLSAGDRVVLSDMSRWDGQDRVRLR
jgi:multidrug efflux pump subunit AcrA (membrane-fusion protein)